MVKAVIRILPRLILGQAPAAHPLWGFAFASLASACRFFGTPPPEPVAPCLDDLRRGFKAVPGESDVLRAGLGLAQIDHSGGCMGDTRLFAAQVLLNPSHYGASLGYVQPSGDKETAALASFLLNTVNGFTRAMRGFQTAPLGVATEGYGGIINAPHMALALPPRTGGTDHERQAAVTDNGNAKLVAEYFARVFEKVALRVFAVGQDPHKLDLSDLFHAHLIVGRDGIPYLVFHAKEYPSDQAEGALKHTTYTTQSAAYAYRNVLWKSSTNEIVALDASGAMGDNGLTATDASSAIFKSLIVPFTHATIRNPMSQANYRNYTDYFQAKTVYEDFLGAPVSILVYRCPRKNPHCERVVFNEQRGGARHVLWSDGALTDAVAAVVPDEYDIDAMNAVNAVFPLPVAG